MVKKQNDAPSYPDMIEELYQAHSSLCSLIGFLYTEHQDIIMRDSPNKEMLLRDDLVKAEKKLFEVIELCGYNEMKE